MKEIFIETKNLGGRAGHMFIVFSEKAHNLETAYTADSENGLGDDKDGGKEMKIFYFPLVYK